MTRLFALTLAASTAITVSALAAPQHQRIRGTVASIENNVLMVHSRSGKDVKIMLDTGTKYAGVVKADLSNIEKGSYIGTATKGSGAYLVALEVVIFPPSMRGAGDGHYAWDKLPDTTLSGGARVSSSMTNGNVASASNAGAAKDVSSAMTNGNVQSATDQSGAKKLTVTYKGGQKTIVVPPTAPIVTFKPADRSIVTTGAPVFVNAIRDGSTIKAGFVGVGENGVKPPM